ncbi:benzyl alcohol O-benzoyltransferase-like [Macadamia integrifolia]|uniref:benzyl alcohol O-benzoyltransferase-like n=1 Tax=Macadamia integrifolia TaxID=60698 RepID=UPI001C4FBFC8|nr:benzyl alcohol O-benzoyltransferase-like [Macadamia integrifolia]
MTSSSSTSLTSLVFTVQRRESELIAPARPTPHEFKYLSDIDDQEGLRVQIPSIQFYRNEPGMRGYDPIKVIRKAIAEALVFYYPFAGRLRENPGRKLVVECTGDGVLFIEADADVSLDQFGDALQPPFPCLEELLYDVPGSDGILGCPLLLIQVTRLICGGFIFALRSNHTMCDATGLVQFLSAVGEIARGARPPSVSPVWKRELLNARKPPHVTFLHHEYNELPDTKGTQASLDDMAHRSFFFGPAEVAALWKHVPPNFHSCSRFELLTACLWRCRTIAIQPDPNDEMRLMCIINVRAKLRPPLPVGFYGNALAYPVAISSAANLCQNSLGYALELVKKVKNSVNDEYMRSVADLMVMKGRPPFTMVRTYLVSDLTRAGFRNVDFGWGKAVYGGAALGRVASFQIPFRNHKGEDGIVVPIYLPQPVMERFVKEIERMIKEPTMDRSDNTNAIKSAM